MRRTRLTLGASLALAPALALVLTGTGLAPVAIAQETFPRVDAPGASARPTPPRAARPPVPPKAATPAPRPAPTATPARTERERDIAKATEPMKIVRVRSVGPGCGATCPEWISAEGRILSGVTANQLQRVLASLGDAKLPVFIHSAGGSVEEAYAMGRLIRAKGLAVSVTKTEFETCSADDKACRLLAGKGIRAGTPKPPLSVCASSCVFVLAGGTERHVGPASLVGVHQYESTVTHVQVLQKYRMVPDEKSGALKKEIISEQRVGSRTVKTRTRGEVYDKSTAYFAEMGVAKAIMEPLLATPHSNMHWLTAAEIATSRIATDRRRGDQVIAAKAVPSPPTVDARSRNEDREDTEALAKKLPAGKSPEAPSRAAPTN